MDLPGTDYSIDYKAVGAGCGSGCAFNVLVLTVLSFLAAAAGATPDNISGTFIFLGFIVVMVSHIVSGYMTGWVAGHAPERHALIVVALGMVSGCIGMEISDNAPSSFGLYIIGMILYIPLTIWGAKLALEARKERSTNGQAIAPVATAKGATTEPNELTRREWRELGFYYDRDDTTRVWRLVGSVEGLGRFVKLLRDFSRSPLPDGKSEHGHYGPYRYLKLKTWPSAGIDQESIHGSRNDLDRLASLIERDLRQAGFGATFAVGQGFTSTCMYELVLEVREPGFDPASEDASLA